VCISAKKAEAHKLNGSKEKETDNGKDEAQKLNKLKKAKA